MSCENRASFFARFERPPYSCLFTTEEVARIRLAYLMAKHGHRGQMRKECDADGKQLRYFEHPRRVALIILDELRIPDTTLIMAAFFHDCVEDTDEIDVEVIRIVGGDSLVRLVMLVTKEPKEGYVERLGEFGGWHALTLKACDRLDNLRSLPQTEPAFQRKQIKETRERYLPLFKRMVECAPAKYRDKSRMLCEEIRMIVARAEERFRQEDEEARKKAAPTP